MPEDTTRAVEVFSCRSHNIKCCCVGGSLCVVQLNTSTACVVSSGKARWFYHLSCSSLKTAHYLNRTQVLATSALILEEKPNGSSIENKDRLLELSCCKHELNVNNASKLSINENIKNKNKNFLIEFNESIFYFKNYFYLTKDFINYRVRI